jgi:two-component system response regulator YesN
MQLTYIAFKKLKNEEYSMYKVLIVDDDESIIGMLREFPDWESYGFTIEEEACCGKEALERISAKYFDLVITDIRMPGMDGLKFLSKLKARNLDSCLVLMSTYNDFEYAQEGIRIGIFDYIVKPLKNHVLSKALERIKKYLDEKRYLQKRREEEKQMLFEDNLRFFYPTNQERKLSNLIMSGDYEVINAASSTCLELFNLTNQDLVKTGILLEKMLLKLREEINTAFPWLGTLEEISFDSALANVESIDDSKAKFLGCINMMLEIIKKYELHYLDSIVESTCRYVVKHIEGDIRLEDISKEIHISRNYIGKLFKQKTGSNFIDYVTKVKMEHAKYLLGTGKYRNYEVCEKLGYSSPDYFCRLFKDYTGYTPIEFRKMSI